MHNVGPSTADAGQVIFYENLQEGRKGEREQCGIFTSIKILTTSKIDHSTGRFTDSSSRTRKSGVQLANCAAILRALALREMGVGLGWTLNIDLQRYTLFGIRFHICTSNKVCI